MQRKAVSPLIAVVLVVVFAIAIGTIIFAWVHEYTKSTTEAASSGTIGRQGVVSCANQILTISEVSITPNTGTITQFNDLTSSKTFSSETGGTFIAYVRLPNNATVTTTALTITGQAYE